MKGSSPSGKPIAVMAPSPRKAASLAAGILLLVNVGTAWASPAVSEAQYKAASKMVRNVCAPKFGLPKEQLDLISGGDVPDDPKVKCYMACIMQTVQTLKNGKIDFKMMRLQADKMLPTTMRESAIMGIENCSERAVGADNCEVAYNFVICTKETNPDRFFFP